MVAASARHSLKHKLLPWLRHSTFGTLMGSKTTESNFSLTNATKRKCCCVQDSWRNSRVCPGHRIALCSANPFCCNLYESHNHRLTVRLSFATKTYKGSHLPLAERRL